jgi:hypothetical protein
VINWAAEMYSIIDADGTGLALSIAGLFQPMMEGHKFLEL